MAWFFYIFPRRKILIDSAHMVKFQEMTDSTTIQEMSEMIPKTKKKFYIKPRIDGSGEVRVNTKVDPKRFVDAPLQFNETYND